VYDHGGLTLQECVVPLVDIVANPPAQGRPAIKAVTWNSSKMICKVDAVFAEGAVVTLERLSSSVGEPGTVNSEGKAKVVLDEVDDLLGEMVNLVLRRDGQKVAEEQLQFGEAWHAT
jgi:hypothetical protein